MSDFLKINRNGQILEILLLKGIEKVESIEKRRVESADQLCSGKDPNI